ncbi:MAG: hypothetical protein ACFCVC_12275 [Acidimicrobiia bacterium]
MTGVLARRAIIVIAVVAVAAMSTLVVRARQLDVETETAVMARAAATVGAVETLAGQAIVFGLDAEAGVVEAAQASEALAAFDSGLDDLRQVDTTPGTAPVVRAFILDADRIASDLLAGNVAGARMRFSADLAGHRANLGDVVGERIAELVSQAQRLDDTSRRLAWASVVAAVAGLVWASAPLGGWIGTVIRGRRHRHDVPVEAARPLGPPVQERIVIQLPDEPNDLPARLRHPRVEDLGWLLEQVLVPFGRAGWAVDVSCPAVGVDCDPADVREMVGSVLRRADTAGAERIGMVVRTSGNRVRVTVADDGASVFGEDGNAMGHGPVALRSAVRTRAEAVGATLTWRRSGGLNLATLELPRLVRAEVAVHA